MAWGRDEDDDQPMRGRGGRKREEGIMDGPDEAAQECATAHPREPDGEEAVWLAAESTVALVREAPRYFEWLLDHLRQTYPDDAGEQGVDRTVASGRARVREYGSGRREVEPT